LEGFSGFEVHQLGQTIGDFTERAFQATGFILVTVAFKPK